MTIAADSTPESASRLKRELKAAESRKRAMALLLIAPLAIFLLLIFVVPIGALLTRAAQNPEVANALPHTLSALSAWDRKTPPPDAAFAALATDLTAIADSDGLGALARRLNVEIPGYRSLVAKSARAMPFVDDNSKPLQLTPAQVRAKFVELDERWNDIVYWQAIAKNAGTVSPFYLLASLDHRQDGVRPHHSDRSRSADLSQGVQPHVRDRRGRDLVRAAARLSARVLDFDAVRAARESRDDSRADPVLDVDPRARRRMDRDSAKRRAREQGADRAAACCTIRLRCCSTASASTSR